MIEYAPDDEIDVQYDVFVWPEEVVYYRGDYVGYQMPLIDVSQYTELKPYIRDELDEEFTVEKAKLAYVLATAVYVVHGLGHAVGDFNYENILVSDGQFKLIDCDAYSIAGRGETEYHGRTMYNETIPPEGRPTDGMERARRADSFNLAVWLFRIISGNWYPPYANPYQAKGTLAVGGDIVDMMEENPYPYWDPQPGILEPVGGQDAYESLPESLRFAFESAFLGGKFHPFKRPSPGVWRRLLMSVLADFGIDTIPKREVASLESSFVSSTPTGETVDVASLESTDPHRAAYGDTISVAGTVVSVRPLTTFTNNAGETDYVSNIKLETKGREITLTFWNKQGIVAARSLFPGLVLRAEGQIRRSNYDGRDRELHVNSFSAKPDYDNYRQSLDSLTEGTFDLHLRGTIVGKTKLTSFRKNGEQRYVTNVVIADESGHVRITCWNEMAKRIASAPVGLTLELVDGMSKTDDCGRTYVNISESTIPPAITDIAVNYTLETADLADVTPGDVIDVTGEVKSRKPGRDQTTLSIDGASIAVDTKELCDEYDVAVGDRIFLSDIAVTKANHDANTYRGFLRQHGTLSILPE